jgi:hypothetical protein
VVGATGGLNIGYEVREKDLPKLHKAVWVRVCARVPQPKDINDMYYHCLTITHVKDFSHPVYKLLNQYRIE